MDLVGDLDPWQKKLLERTMTSEADKAAWTALTQMPPQTRTPVLAIRRPVVAGDRVKVWWGENRGKVGTVTGNNDGAWFVRFDGAEKGSGLHIEDALLVVVDAPPAFENPSQAQLWLESSGEQEYFPGDMVRLSEVRGRDRAIVYVRIVRYLGVQGKEPPKYLVNNDGEPKIVPAYFIRGRV